MKIAKPRKGSTTIISISNTGSSYRIGKSNSKIVYWSELEIVYNTLLTEGFLSRKWFKNTF